VSDPADVTTVVLAWGAALVCCLAGALFGQTARDAPLRHRRTRTRRIGLFVSLSGPWIALLGAAGAGAVSGAWLLAATAAVAGVLGTSLAGLALTPH
jgi:hypothetical protein